jgi:hypothetical protein
MVLCTLVLDCTASRAPSDWASVREVTPSFLLALEATDPALAADEHGRVALTFVTRDSTGKNLWLSLSRDSGLTFAPAVRVNPRAGTVSSYAEGRPQAVFGPAGRLAIAWTERCADTARAFDLVVSASGDGGATLSPPAIVNDDRGIDLRAWRRAHAWSVPNPRAFHGFPALTFLADGTLFAAWLDEREFSGTGEPPFSALYAAVSLDGGQSWSANTKLRDSVCACCRPMAATASGQVAVAYRNGARDVRDPALMISGDGGRTFHLDTLMSPDRWLLNMCPSQGPVLSFDSAAGGLYAWFTGAGTPGVYVMPWQSDRGPAGVKRMMADGLIAAEHPRLTSLGAATLIGVEGRRSDDTTRRVLAVRALDPDGSLTPWSFLGADVRAGWVTTLDPRTALACWSEQEPKQQRVRIARLRRRA